MSLLSSLEGILKDHKLGKQKHSSAIALLCIAHVLPLACNSENIIKHIYLEHPNSRWERNFHAMWTLGGQNDNIIQPARNAVLNYYKVYVSISPPTVLALIPIRLNSIYFLN